MATMSNDCIYAALQQKQYEENLKKRRDSEKTAAECA
jgi:hypothetical protein